MIEYEKGCFAPKFAVSAKIEFFNGLVAGSERPKENFRQPVNNGRMCHIMRFAKWISCPPEETAPLIRKKFVLEHPGQGILEITGLGFFVAFCNGKRISEDCMTPLQSDYEERSLTSLIYPLTDRFTHRVYYHRYDLSPFLEEGENVLEVLLGNGWYRQTERIAEGHMEFSDRLKARFSAVFANIDGTVSHIRSDGSERYRSSFITSNNLFLGETQDARLISAPTEDFPVETVPDWDAELCPAECPADRVIRRITPRLISQNGETRLYDAGENISGWVAFKTAAASGSRITVRHSEELAADGTLDFASSGGGMICRSGLPQIQADTYFCDGTPREFHPIFCYHTFRYFEITGPADSPEVQAVHSDIPVTSSFESGSTALNWLYEAYLRTQLDNMHGGVPSDCPHRERLGYTGDGQVTASSAMLLLDSRAFYAKWIQDILDCQDKKTGHVQHTAPFMGGGGGPGGWGGAIVIVPYRYYRHYGDMEMLRRCYPAMLQWIAYMKEHSENGLVVREEKGGWCLGDWAALSPMVIPDPFVNTCYFIKALNLCMEIGALLEEPSAVQNCAAVKDEARSALYREYYNPETGSFCDGVQGADAFALDAGLGDNRTLDALCARYEKLNFFDTGFLGTDLLIDVLFRNRKTDLAYALLTSEKEGSYDWMRQHGATTLWEYFSGAESHCHPMFGAPVRHLFHSLLGIRQTEGSAGFSSLEIAPQIPALLSHASGKIQTVSGEVSVSWEKGDGSLTITTRTAPGQQAVLRFGGKACPLTGGESHFTFPLGE